MDSLDQQSICESVLTSDPAPSLAEGYTKRHSTVPLNLTTGSGFATALSVTFQPVKTVTSFANFMSTKANPNS